MNTYLLAGVTHLHLLASFFTYLQVQGLFSVGRYKCESEDKEKRFCWGNNKCFVFFKGCPFYKKTFGHNTRLLGLGTGGCFFSFIEEL